MVVLLTALVLGSLYLIFGRGKHASSEIVQNLILNENAQRIVDHLAFDIREANVVEPGSPPFISSIESLKIETNPASLTSLILKKAVYDLTSKAPEKCTFKKVQYIIEKTDPRPGASVQSYSLDRVEGDLDKDGKEIPWDRKRKTLVEKIEEMVFFRIKPDSQEEKISGAGTIYFKIKMARSDAGKKEQGYKNEVISAIRIRGSVPEGI